MSTTTRSATATTTTEKAETKEVARDTKRLYVRWDFNDDMLKALFGQFGTVGEARVATLRGRAKSSFGFVTFESEDAANKALNALNNNTVQIKPSFNVEFAALERRQRQPRNKESGNTNSGNNNNNSNQGNNNNNQGNNDNNRRSNNRRRGRGGRRTGGRNDNNNSGNNQGNNNQGGNNNNKSNNQGRNNNNTNQGNNNQGGQQRQQRTRDPSWGSVVQLNPDPIKNPIDKNATLTTLQAGTRQFRKRTDTKFIQSLALNADPSKGPFHCEFQLGGFSLKLLSVSVRCKNNTTRVTCKVEESSTGRNRNVFLYFKADGSISHRSFELRKPNTEQKDGSQELFFVTIESITVDKNTGLWSSLLLSMVSLIHTPKPQTSNTTSTNTSNTSSSSTQSSSQQSSK